MTGNDLVKLASKYIGTKENPSGSNNVIFNTKYYGREINDPNYAWCAVFIWYLFNEAGRSDLYFNGDKTAYCPSLMAWARSIDLDVDVKEGAVGDIVFFDWNHNEQPDHVGIIEKNNGNGTYTTIEGNASDAVRRMTRNVTDICCIYRPKYDTEKSQPSAWAKTACEWCIEKGIFKGNESGDYMWQEPVTREQLAVILYTLDKINI